MDSLLKEIAIKIIQKGELSSEDRRELAEKKILGSSFNKIRKTKKLTKNIIDLWK